MEISWNFVSPKKVGTLCIVLRESRVNFLVATKFFQVSCHFSMIFIKFFKIP